ncbi:hypothetical protein K502DRAFT_323691 [Neoconidiobolus thromboides FSU 785]|nr:hypothetical protein K502DRAFT_323691 [Neoconidiobolus thromboides FSU 785]
MEVLPEYNSINESIELPSYHSPLKQFTIKSKFSLNVGIHRCNWNVCEKGSDIVWYKLYPNLRGVSLKESNKSALIDLIQIPSSKTGLDLYNFIINDKSQNSRVTMEVQSNDKELIYYINVYKTNLKGQDKETYCISKRSANHGNNSVWCLYNVEYPNEVLAKFTLAFSCQRIADIALYNNIPLFEYHIFLTSISQCLLHLFSIHSNLAS